MLKNHLNLQKEKTTKLTPSEKRNQFVAKNLIILHQSFLFVLSAQIIAAQWFFDISVFFCTKIILLLR